MPVNGLTIEQAADVANEVFKQGVGTGDLAPITAANFVSVANTSLLSGYDPMLRAISQVLSRTIFAIRPYYEKLGGLEVDDITYGNHVRKLSMLNPDKVMEEDESVGLENDVEVSYLAPRFPKILQTNFYGQVAYQKKVTVFRSQLNTAVQSLDEFGRLISMIWTDATNQMSKTREDMKRATLVNAIAAKYANDPENVIHLLSEYNAYTGKTYTEVDLHSPDVYKAFMQWAFARIQNVSDFMTDYTTNFHTNPAQGTINRVTPVDMQRAFMLSVYQNEISGQAKANTFHNNWLEYPWTEKINYWQNVNARDEFSVVPVYMGADGSVVSPTEAVTKQNVFGCIFDREAIGITVCDQWTGVTPFNPAGGFTNYYFHYTQRYWNDQTENGVVFALD